MAGELSKALDENTVSPEEALQMMNDFVSGNQDMNKAAKNIEGMLGQISSTRHNTPVPNPGPPGANHPMDTPPDVAMPANDDTHRFIGNPNEMPSYLGTGFTDPNLQDAMQKSPEMMDSSTTFIKPPDSSVTQPEGMEPLPQTQPMLKPQHLDTSVIQNEDNSESRHAVFMNPQEEAAAKVEMENNGRPLIQMEHENTMEGQAFHHPMPEHELASPQESPLEEQPPPQERPQPQELPARQEPPPQQEPLPQQEQFPPREQQDFHGEEVDKMPESRQQVMEKLSHFSTEGQPPPVDVFEGQVPELNNIVHSDATSGETRSPSPSSQIMSNHHNVNKQQYQRQQHQHQRGVGRSSNINNHLVMEPFRSTDDGYENPQLNRNAGDHLRKLISSGKTSMNDILNKMDPHEIPGQADPSLIKQGGTYGGASASPILEEGVPKMIDNPFKNTKDISSMYSKPIGNIFGDEVNNQPIGRPMPLYGDSASAAASYEPSGQFERKFRTPHPVRKSAANNGFRKPRKSEYTGKRRSKLAEMYEDSIFPEDNMDLASLQGDLQGKTLTNYDRPGSG